MIGKQLLESEQQTLPQSCGKHYSEAQRHGQNVRASRQRNRLEREFKAFVGYAHDLIRLDNERNILHNDERAEWLSVIAEAELQERDECDNKPCHTCRTLGRECRDTKYPFC